MDKYWYSYIGFICQILDECKVNYHHCGTWFRLFLNNQVYSVNTIKVDNYKSDINKNNRIIVRKEKCTNNIIQDSVVFQGTLQEFDNWLQNNR